MKSDTVQVKHTYWTIMTNQYGDSTTADSILLVPMFVRYIEPEANESGHLCVCAMLDCNGKIPEPLPIRKVREVFLYETFEEAWGALYESVHGVLKSMDKMRGDLSLFDLSRKDNFLLFPLNMLEDLPVWPEVNADGYSRMSKDSDVLVHDGVYRLKKESAAGCISLSSEKETRLPNNPSYDDEQATTRLGDTMTVEEYQRMHSGEERMSMPRQEGPFVINPLPLTGTMGMHGGTPAEEPDHV